MSAPGYPMNETVAAIIEANRRAAKKGVLSMWTVYDKPKDHPTEFVARRFDCTAQGPVATLDAWAGSLELIRETLHHAGMIRMERRHPDDEPHIIETCL
jgi:hypothetical protein